MCTEVEVLAKNGYNSLTEKRADSKKSFKTCAIIPQIILIKTTSVFNGGVHSKTVKIPKSLDRVHFAPIG